MRLTTRFAFAVLGAGLIALGALAPAADPAPLVKPVTPTGTAARVRFPISEDAKTFAQFAATIPKPKGNKGETIAVKVMIDTLPNNPQVELKTWKAWGFEVPADGPGTIPELVIKGSQISPKATKGRDVELRLTNLKVNVIGSPGGKGAAFGDCDIWLTLNHLTVNPGASETRFFFGDRFVELTAPTVLPKGGNLLAKRLNTDTDVPPEPKATAGELVPVMGVTKATGLPSFVFASVNGYTEYTTPAGKNEKVNVYVSSITNYAPPGILMTATLARGCGIKLEKEPQPGEVVAAVAKELRLEVLTGDGFKTKKDFVLKDVKVFVNDNRSDSRVWLGPRFVEEYLTDGVYGCGTDGAWRLYGRVKPDLLEDTKTRKPPEAPKKP